MNILIVDDEPLARENLRCLLEEEKDIHIIGECSNAIEAIVKYIVKNLMWFFLIFKCHVLLA